MISEKCDGYEKKIPTEEELIELGVKSWDIWEKEKSVFDWSYSDTETCFILEGEVEVIDNTSGEKLEFKKVMLKRLFTIIIILLVIFGIATSAKAQEESKIYLFYGTGCPHCAQVENFFEELYSSAAILSIDDCSSNCSFSRAPKTSRTSLCIWLYLSQEKVSIA